MSTALENKAKPCDYCGLAGELKAQVGRGEETRLFCHSDARSCYNSARGRYFEACICDKQDTKSLGDEHSTWTITRFNRECPLHGYR